jgi:hypothetical protein
MTPRLNVLALFHHPFHHQVIKEVEGGLQGWIEKDRWAELGIRDQVKDSSHKWAY